MMRYIASFLLLIVCSTSASAFEQRGDVDFYFGGPSGAQIPASAVRGVAPELLRKSA